jgi:hypothetical protein
MIVLGEGWQRFKRLVSPELWIYFDAALAKVTSRSWERNPAGVWGSNGWRAFNNTRRVGHSNGCPAVGSYLRGEPLRALLGLLGPIQRRANSIFWEWQLHHRGLPLSGKLDCRNKLRPNGSLPPNSQQNSASWRDNRGSRTWISCVGVHMGCLWSRCMASESYLLCSF